MKSNLDKVIALLVKQTGKDESMLNAETPLETLGIDSFDFIEFMFLVEDEFGIEIEINYNDVAGRMRTIGDVVASVEAVMGKKTAPAAPVLSAPVPA
jgi:acyl carrier protein